MTTFQSFGLPENMLRNLQSLHFTSPTPIQEEAIPVALSGRDILGSAQTGTGKTAAFAIPLIQFLATHPTQTALVLLPTRELAEQVLVSLQSLLGQDSRLRGVLLIGGASMHRQLQQLKSHPRVVVGTPGRINDHLQQHTLSLDAASFLVLDEMDRMLDMGFGVQLAQIAKHLPTTRQTLMFSATLPDKIEREAQKYLHEPVRIAIGSTIAVAQNVQQETVALAQAEKYAELIHQLQKQQGSTLVFVKTKYGADKMARKLRKENFNAAAIHGDLRQNQRTRVIDDFRSGRLRILVATDIAARGLDVPQIAYVINYDLPQCPEDYIHRIGRTARAGASGVAVTLLCEADEAQWQEIQRLLHPEKFARKNTPRPAQKRRAKTESAPRTAHSSRPSRPQSEQHARPTQTQAQAHRRQTMRDEEPRRIAGPTQPREERKERSKRFVRYGHRA